MYSHTIRTQGEHVFFDRLFCREQHEPDLGAETAALVEGISNILWSAKLCTHIPINLHFWCANLD